MSLRRRPVDVRLQPQSRQKTFEAPIRGWIQSENLSKAGRATGGAHTLENFWPTTRGIVPRGGLLRHATVPSRVYSMPVYSSGGTEKMFACTATAVYNVTSPADPLVAPSADLSAQTSGAWSFAMSSSAGGDYLTICNGADPRQVYDGSSWSTSPAITGVNSDDLSYVWVFKNRLFFVEYLTTTAWALAVDSIGGAAIEIALPFQRGGYLLFGGTWSQDSGDGADDLCVFISSKGEVLVYQGTDPSDPDAWGMIGRYEIGRPLGPQAHLKAGGDLVIGTVDGLIPLSAAMQKDPAALTLAAVSRPIEDEWKTQASRREGVYPWSILKWPEKNLAIVGLPLPDATHSTYAYGINLLTGAFAKATGWDASALATMNGLGFLGTSDGKIQQMDAGGSDDGSSYESVFVGLYDDCKAPSAEKTVTAVRATFRASRNFIPKLSISSNYEPNLPTAPSAAVHESADVWDTGLWDTAVFDAGAGTFRIQTGWVSVAGAGFVIAPQLQITNNHTTAPDAELVSLELNYTVSTSNVMV